MVDVILATERPVAVFDPRTGGTIDEILVINGMELPASRQVPLLDSHKRDSVRSVLGSIRNLRKGHNAAGVAVLRGTLSFSDGESAKEVESLYRGGHLSDVSVGARRLEIEYRDGRRYVTRSEIIEGSVVLSGADSGAKTTTALAVADRRQMTVIAKPVNELARSGLLKLLDDPRCAPFVRRAAAENRQADGATILLRALTSFWAYLENDRTRRLCDALDLPWHDEKALTDAMCRSGATVADVLSDINSDYCDGPGEHDRAMRSAVNRFIREQRCEN